MTARHATTKDRLSGYSLLEVVLAVALVTGTLTPSLMLIRDGLQLSEEADQVALLANYGVSKLEEQMASVSATWTDTNPPPGDFSADGFAEIRFLVARTFVASVGSGDQLMDISVTVYIDSDNDDTLDAAETQVNYRTLLGRFATYEAIANS